jgi:hypothetical protein
MEDTAELRRELSQNWEILVSRLTNADVPGTAVFTTMVESAASGLVATQGHSAAADYLKGLAERLANSDPGLAREFVRGQSAPDREERLVAPELWCIPGV